MMQDNEGFPELPPHTTGQNDPARGPGPLFGCRQDPHSSRCAASVSSLRSAEPHVSIVVLELKDNTRQLDPLGGKEKTDWATHPCIQQKMNKH